VKTAERTRIAFQRGTPDRVPVHCWLGLPLIKQLRPPDKTTMDMLHWWIDDPMGSIVKMQQDLGLDPMITTYSQHIGEHEIWPRMLFPASLRDGHLGRDLRGLGARRGLARAFASDPHSRRRARLLVPHRGRLRHLLPRLPAQGDEPESKLPALQHFPSADLYDMSVLTGMVEKVGDEAW